MDSRKVLSERRYKAGYVVRKELVDSGTGDGSTFEMTSAYTPNGDYIGSSRLAFRLCKTRGIQPMKKTDDSNICSIGFCDKEQKWYGWSHRAMYGFGVGSKVKLGDCAYMPSTKEEVMMDTEQFWGYAIDEDKVNVYSKFESERESWYQTVVGEDGKCVLEDTPDDPDDHNLENYSSPDALKVEKVEGEMQDGVAVYYTYTDKIPNEKLRGKEQRHFTPFPTKWGRGAWVAKDLDDARQMAVDFAEGVG